MLHVRHCSLHRDTLSAIAWLRRAPTLFRPLPEVYITGSYRGIVSQEWLGTESCHPAAENVVKYCEMFFFSWMADIKGQWRLNKSETSFIS